MVKLETTISSDDEGDLEKWVEKNVRPSEREDAMTRLQFLKEDYHRVMNLKNEEVETDAPDTERAGTCE